jgi:beta-galactosidase
MSEFKIEGKKFVFNNESTRILSGAIHYFRVLPEYWKDRLLKLKACGFNTVETYVAWNIHEPKQGEFDFEGMGDICKFIEIAGELGLHVILRPGPFICAEWEFGGLPAWLIKEPNIRLRCFNEVFLKRVDAFYDVLLPKLKPYLCTNGGPIIAMQVENEYGSYGNDKEYLTYLKDGMIKRGIDVLLFTSDGPGNLTLEGGTLEEIFKTVNFGSSPEKAFDVLLEYQKDQPLMCMEFWNGWFDHWGEIHHTRCERDVAEVLDKMLSMGASVNFYMFHGGTNFGFMNGSNYDKAIMPTVTSYDYDSPLNEAGDPTEKYFEIQNVIAKYESFDKNLLPEASLKKGYGKIQLTHKVELFKALAKISSPIKRAYTETMEMLNQNYGFILYRTKIKGPKKGCHINIMGINDRAQIFMNGRFVDIIERDKNKPVLIDIEDKEIVLDILVENLGRINYGSKIGDKKGILEGVKLEYQFISNWEMYTLPLDNIEKLEFEEIDEATGPCFYKGNLEVDEAKDTFLLMEGWSKGVVFVNGFNLGRYWEIGPQKTLYLPAPLLNKGSNEIVVFELQKNNKAYIESVEKPILG